ncbi:MAG: hypothetical protein LUH15_19710 [Tannerellaceae bacterium]|nr:hypothetical protein [Tannerellaceae bacterium]
MPSTDTVILFDCENSTGKFQEFNIDRFQIWNRNHGTQFRKILYITFGKEQPCAEHIKRKTELMKSRFRIGNQTTYTVTATELDYLAGQKSGTVPVHFSGEETNSFTDAFLHIVQDLELYELRTFRMLNIYSLLFTEKAKHYILNEIFSAAEDNCLISDETKQRIKDLSIQERKELESALTMLIDSIQQNHIFRKEIINRAITRPVLVVPELFIRDKILKNELNTALGILGGLPMKTWSEIDHNTPKNILILAYRDQGKYPYHFFPNLLESNFPNAPEVHACLIPPPV